MLKTLATLLLSTALAWGASPTLASDYPSRHIRMITVASAGGGGDSIARMFASKMGEILGTTIIVENRPGAGGAIAMDALARSPNDGYTMGLSGFSASVLVPIVRTKTPYDVQKDFVPVGMIGTAPILLAATNDFPANNVQELIAYAKANPDKRLMYASWGVGSTGHFCGELLNQRAGIEIEHIPYNGVGQIMSDMLGGQIQLAQLDMASGTPLVTSGRIKALGSCVERSPSLPDVRGYKEDGVSFDADSALQPMWPFFMPAGTSPEIVDKLAAAMQQVMAMPEVNQQLIDYGVTPGFVNSRDFQKLLADGIPQWREIATRSNIQVE